MAHLHISHSVFLHQYWCHWKCMILDGALALCSLIISLPVLHVTVQENNIDQKECICRLIPKIQTSTSGIVLGITIIWCHWQNNHYHMDHTKCSYRADSLAYFHLIERTSVVLWDKSNGGLNGKNWEIHFRSSIPIQTKIIIQIIQTHSAICLMHLNHTIIINKEIRTRMK